MDLNKLYFDHQLLLMKARSPVTPQARSEKLAAARAIAGRIARFQHALGAASAAAWGSQSTQLCECSA
ncbi:MAG: hypothetical protein B7Z08_04165 [Sphingomonadales bacterium 32-68-7]|nr:MAG: hypothetical protein B7Z33_13650 [Sphingomonadales bacterium 12-68-11]OYX09724.1 MAG: hypothetical protein B7Z08_04165 [Sphingomonadales bacterium 32-68-7]